MVGLNRNIKMSHREGLPLVLGGQTGWKQDSKSWVYQIETYFHITRLF